RRVSPPLPEAQNADTRPLLSQIIARAGLETTDGMVRPPGHSADLGAAEAGIAELERRLAAAPFSAPEADDLRELGLGARELAVACRGAAAGSPRRPARPRRGCGSSGGGRGAPRPGGRGRRRTRRGGPSARCPRPARAGDAGPRRAGPALRGSASPGRACGER